VGFSGRAQQSLCKIVGLLHGVQMKFAPLCVLLLVTLTCWLQPLTAASVEVDAGSKHQEITGFGTCLISWGKFPEETYTEAFAKIYADDMGMNILRCELSGGTLPDKVGLQEIAYENFKLDGYSGSAQVFLDFAKKAKAVNPDLLVIGTVWTPPGWMKKHGQGLTDPKKDREKPNNLGNSGLTYGESENYVTKEHYPHFSKWLVEMAKLFEANGTPLYAVSAGNEVMFTQWFQSNLWTGEDYATIVSQLADDYAKAGMDVKLFGPETMTGHNFAHGNPTYFRALEESGAIEDLDIIATHGYEDGIKADMSASSPAQFWKTVEKYGKPYWVTEGGTGGHEWPEPLTGVASAIHNNFVHGNASAFVPWQISGSKPSGHDLMVNDQMTKKSHAVRQYSKFIERGAVRVDASSDNPKLAVSAYVHPERRTLTIVAINPEKQAEELEFDVTGLDGELKALETFGTTATQDVAPMEKVELTAGSGSFKLPAESIVTFQGTFE